MAGTKCKTLKAEINKEKTQLYSCGVQKSIKNLNAEIKQQNLKNVSEHSRHNKQRIKRDK